MTTHPRYYTHMTDYELSTKIRTVETRENQLIVTLEDTIFHPQGGGQPADTGTIRSTNCLLEVTRTKRREDGAIEHIGTLLEGTLEAGDTVDCTINQTNRQLYTRLHSAGHLLDVALKQLGVHWEPGKGHHFADGPYVEYRTMETPDPQLAAKLEQMLAELIVKDIPTTVEFQGALRIVTLANKAVPCGGTHVQSLGELGSVHIRNVKQKAGTVKIGYTVS